MISMITSHRIGRFLNVCYFTLFGSLTLVLVACSTSTTPATPGTGLTSRYAPMSDPVNPLAPTPFAEGRILVKFSSQMPDAERAAIHARLGGALQSTIPGIDAQVVSVPAGQETVLVAAYSSEEGVRFAEPDYLVGVTALPIRRDEYFPIQWNLRKIQWEDAAQIETFRSFAKVAVLDTGIDTGHPELSFQVELSRNFTGVGGVMDRNGHGTLVAGIVAAESGNHIGVNSVAGHATSLLIGKVVGDNGVGAYSWTAAGIVWAADNHARVINLSFGAYVTSQTVESAIDYAWNKGVIICAAAGNDGVEQPFYPAAYDKVIAVAATDEDDQRALFFSGEPTSWGSSNWGDWVDISAPGTNIYSSCTAPYDDYTYADGTSMACPHVAAVIALTWGRFFLQDAEWVRIRVEDSVDRISTDHPIGYGRINAFYAVLLEEPLRP